MDETNLPNLLIFVSMTVTGNNDLLYGCMNLSLVHIYEQQCCQPSQFFRRPLKNMKWQTNFLSPFRRLISPKSDCCREHETSQLSHTHRTQYLGSCSNRYELFLSPFRNCQLYQLVCKQLVRWTSGQQADSWLPFTG